MKNTYYVIPSWRLNPPAISVTGEAALALQRIQEKCSEGATEDGAARNMNIILLKVLQPNSTTLDVYGHR